MKAKKSVTLKNLSPIKISVEINISPCENGVIDVNPKYLEMETNQIKTFDIFLTPSQNKEIISKLTIQAERLYDPQNENYGIFNPKVTDSENNENQKTIFDRRPYIREISILGKGSDGDLTIKPEEIDFGTVKAGFHKKLSFSIFNPTITNFYIKLVPKYLIHFVKKKLMLLLNLVQELQLIFMLILLQLVIIKIKKNKKMIFLFLKKKKVL